MSPPFLIVGLGNPGKEYIGTRHNTGFDVIEAVSKELEVKSSNKRWTTPRDTPAEIIEGELANKRVVLTKPTTYINESGRAVAAVVEKYDLNLSRGNALLILHDDLDLLMGTLRLSVDSSSGGHKGVQSVIDALGTNVFLRLRVGIGPNATPDGHRIPSEKFVLDKFRKEERKKINATIARGVEVIAVLLRDGLAAAQRCANRNE